MSNFEKKIGENMVDDMLPPDPTKPKPSRGTYLDRMDREMGRDVGGVDHSKYDDAFWAKGGDDISDFTGKSNTLDGGSWPKTKKPFKPNVPHPTKPCYKREEYEGPGGWARAKLRDLSKASPLLSMGEKLQIETILLESIIVTVVDEMTDLMEETDLASKGAAGQKLRAFLRQHILDEYVGWDTMVKKYKPVEEKP